MAGMPQRVIDQQQPNHAPLGRTVGNALRYPQTRKKGNLQACLKAPAYQLSIFEMDDPNIGEIRNILLDIQPGVMTPIDCLIKLKELQELAHKSLLISCNEDFFEPDFCNKSF